MDRNFQSKSSPSYSNKDDLFDGEFNLPGYNQSIVEKFAEYFCVEKSERGLMQQKRKVLDFGAGSGSLASIFRQQFSVSPICIEIDSELRSVLKKKNFTSYADLSQLSTKSDYIYSSNVLEHIHNDIDAIKKIYDVLSPGGKIGIYVPALPFLFSDLDRQAGHYRRYRKSELISKFEDCNFKVDMCFYSDSIGVLASMVLKIFGYRNSFRLGANRSLFIYDKYIYPISQFLDKLGLKYICGKNIFLLAHRD
jgi:SAM-dependent methyltransferase